MPRVCPPCDGLCNQGRDCPATKSSVVTKYIYIGEYWVPFPSSEYGGQWVVIAFDDQECAEILERNSIYGWNKEYVSEIKEAVAEAERFALADKNLESKLVNSFFT